MSASKSGVITGVRFSSGKDNFVCELDGCECPSHEVSPMEAGTYITILLDQDQPVSNDAVVVVRTDDLSQRLSEFLLSPVHASPETHSPVDGSCTERPMPVAHLDPQELSSRITEWLMKSPS